MRTLNKVMLIGRLGKDPEVQRFESGTVKASFPLATNESYTDRNGNKVENTDWHNIVMWRGLATVAEKYLRKGNLIYVEGKVKTRSWEDREGTKRYITEIEVQDMSMLNTNNSAVQSNTSSHAKTERVEGASAVTTPAPDEKVVSDDSLPF